MLSARLKSNLTIASFVAVAIVLSMSGRMPSLWAAAVARFLRLGMFIERRFAVDFIDRGDLGFQADEVGHVILWGAGMVVIGLATRKRFRADVVAVCLFAASLGLEIAQGVFTPTRTMAVGDLIANATGIMAGLSVVVITDLMLTLVSNTGPLRSAKTA